jgi:hypothetical protein
MAAFNLTPTRLKALRILQEKPNGLQASVLADAVLTSEYRKANNGGFSRQQATRSGACLALPLVREGLVSVSYTKVGWGFCKLTLKGLAMLDDMYFRQLEEDRV